MDKDKITELRQKITDLVDNIKEHSDRFTGKQHLPTLELNVFLAKLNRLYETTVVLRYLMEEKESEKLTPFIKNDLSDELSDQSLSEKTRTTADFQNEITDKSVIENTQKEVEQPKEETVKDEVLLPENNQGEIQEPDNQLEEKTTQEVNTEQTKNATDGNTKNAEVKTSATPESLVDKLNNKPISNLTQALSLNEKYLYANEFFNKDLNAFLLMVKKINEAQNLQQAMQIFKTEVSKANDTENELVESFTKLIIRRFL
jgi:hypothetical protein